MTDYTLIERMKLTNQFEPNADVSTDEVVSAIEALQSKLGDAIQSSAHWQHQFTEAQAENERLKEQIACFVNGQNQLFEVAKILEDERDSLQSRLDALSKGEPIYQYLMGDGSWIDQTKHSYDYNRNHAPNAVVRIVYAAPKALAPLKDEPWMVKAIDEAYGIGGTP